MDLGHKETDKLIKETEKQLLDIYKRAYFQARKEVQRIRDKIDITDPTKATALLMQEDRLNGLMQRIAGDINNVNKQAIELITGLMEDSYSINYAYESYDIENKLNMDLGYILYDRTVIKEIVKGSLTPFTKVAFSMLEDENILIRALTKEITSSFLLGESMSKLAKRINKIVERKYYESIRIARTESGRLQNHGRYESLKHAKDKGIAIKKQWISTIDKRTRHSHRNLQMEVKDIEERFSNGLLYPNDETGIAKEVINCRCTVTNIIASDYTEEERQLDSDIKRMSFEEWGKSHYMKR